MKQHFIITDDVLTSAFFSSGIEGLSSDVQLLEQYIAHANGCGLESLDTASGKLIESGLAARYPEHFKLGSGIEGLKELVGKLKKGIEGLKKMARGKAKPFIQSIERETTAEINKTYANASWYKDKDATGKAVSVSGLASLIGDVGNYADIERQINEVFKQLDAHSDKVLKEIRAYWGKAKPFYDRAVKAKGDEADKVKADLIAALPKRASLSFDESLPQLGGGKGETIEALTIAQAEALGKLLRDTLTKSVKLAYQAADLVEDLGIDDPEDYDAIEDKELAREVWIRTFWEDYFMPMDRVSKKACDFGVQIMKQLETIIISSVK